MSRAYPERRAPALEVPLVWSADGGRARLLRRQRSDRLVHERSRRRHHVSRFVLVNHRGDYYAGTETHALEGVRVVYRGLAGSVEANDAWVTITSWSCDPGEAHAFTSVCAAYRARRRHAGYGARVRREPAA